MSDDNDISDDADSDELSQEELFSLLSELRDEHRRIDQEVNALTLTGVADMLKLKRMKKIKLSIKDQISYLENMLTPDIIA